VLAHGHKINEESKEVITEKDLYDLAFGLDHAVEYVAMSYVASAKDIHTLREHMVKRGAVTPIIAKIERKEALDNLEEICEASDGIMIARGDLGLALPIEEVPFIERKILKLCNQKGKFVIVATEMLLSMVESPTPTRAEVNDVATAVELGANAVMLSEETARGKYPIEAVTMMKKIVTFAEQEMHAPKYDL
jgi:pyruvate kinase